MTQKTFTVVGGGPVGSLLAISLARHGYKVGLYEGRPDSRRTNIYQGKSINIALSDRGFGPNKARSPSDWSARSMAVALWRFDRTAARFVLTSIWAGLAISNLGLTIGALDHSSSMAGLLVALPFALIAISIAKLELVRSGAKLAGNFRSVVQMRSASGTRLPPRNLAFVVEVPKDDYNAAKQHYFAAAEDDVLVSDVSSTGYPIRLLASSPCQ